MRRKLRELNMLDQSERLQDLLNSHRKKAPPTEEAQVQTDLPLPPVFNKTSARPDGSLRIEEEKGRREVVDDAEEATE